MRFILSWIICLNCTLIISQETNELLKYYDENFFLIEGLVFEDSIRENLYDRLPLNQKNVNQSLWSWSKCSAGLSVRFLSNSSMIKLKWTVLNNKKFNQMPETGVKGLDLYCLNNNQWEHISVTEPTAKVNEVLLISNMKPEIRQYKIFLPLYDGISRLQIGIDSQSIIEKPTPIIQLPVVFYGTSITQGACASRPGMSYTNIISRELNIKCINLGFDSNGKMDLAIAKLMSEIDAKIYVIDCLPNMNIEEVKGNTLPFVELIREKRPNTPLVFVEQMIFSKTKLDRKRFNNIIKKNAKLKEIFCKIIENGDDNVYYINREKLKDNNDMTVDGIHFNDFGFVEFSKMLIQEFTRNELIEK